MVDKYDVLEAYDVVSNKFHELLLKVDRLNCDMRGNSYRDAISHEEALERLNGIMNQIEYFYEIENSFRHQVHSETFNL